jgi:hypothetical protein
MEEGSKLIDREEELVESAFSFGGDDPPRINASMADRSSAVFVIALSSVFIIATAPGRSVDPRRLLLLLLLLLETSSGALEVTPLVVMGDRRYDTLG